VSKADDVFIRQFIIVLVLLAAYGVGAGVLGVWIAGAARDASAGSERATLERIAPVGKLKLGEPGQRARAEAEKAASESAAAAASADESAPDSSGTAGTTVVAAASPAAPASTSAAAVAIDEAGEKIYKQYCFACHLTGVAEAPKTGDTQAWAPRAATGFDALFTNVVDGKGAMPPRSGFPHLSDDELKAGIRYLLAIANLTAE
jgi:cytochrome c5